MHGLGESRPAVLIPEGLSQEVTAALREDIGSGDVTAATFLAAQLRLQDMPRALAHTAAVIYGLLAITDALGRSELALIAAQEEFIRPSHSFEVVRLR